MGFLVAGVDVSQRYEPRATAAIANTGFLTAAGDLAQLFENYGAPPPATVSLVDQTVWSTTGVPRNAQYRLLSNGQRQSWANGGGWSNQGVWVTPQTAAPGAFRARATEQSWGGPGSRGGGTGTWLPLTNEAATTWTVNISTNGTSTWVLRIEIDRGDGNVLATANITLQSTWP